MRIPCLLLAATALAAADNLIADNSSFEAGLSGFDAVPYAWVRQWDRVVQPRIDDATAAHGRCSLRLDNGSGHDAMLVAFPAVRPGAGPVVFSFYARAAEPGARIQAQLHCGYKAVLDRTVTLTADWRRYEVSGTVGTDLVVETRNAGRAGWYAPVLRLLPAAGPWRTVWVDALQVERGGAATPYAPARSLDAALDLADHARRRLLVYDLGERPQAELCVAAAPATAFSARWALRDMLADGIVAGGELAGTTAADGRALLPIALPPTQRRLYRIEAAVTAGGATATALRTYGGIADRSALPGGPFGGSIESFEEGRAHYLAAPDPTHRLAHWREAPGAYADLARRVGWSWVHLYRQTSPLAVMPEQGVHRFEDTDAIVDLLRGRGLELMALLTSHGNYSTIYDFPAWMKTGPASLGGTSRGKGAPLPDLAAWERWCGAMAERYRGRIAAWENWNEPGVKMREAEYLPFAQAAWRAIKAADPQATVIGLCGTWDVGGDLYGWVRGCLKLGAGATMDAIAIHGYHCKDRDYVARVRALARELGGRDFPVWDTETGYCNLALYGQEPHFATAEEGTSYGLASADAPAVVAENLARHTANELASGVARLSYFNLSVPWTTLGKADMGLMNYDGSPDMGLVCQNFLAEAFAGARPGRPLRCEGGVVAYLFERPAGPLAVYWLEDGDGHETRLVLPGAQATDLLGGALAARSEGAALLLPISGQPRFLTAPGADAETIALALEALTIPGASPLKVADTRLTVDGDGVPALALALANRTHQPLPVAIGVRNQPAWVAKAPAWQGTLPADGGATALLPLPGGEPDGTGLLRLAIDSGRQVLAVEQPLRVMAAASAGSPARRVDLDGWATVAADGDDQGLHLRVEVADDSPAHHRDCPSAALEPWQGDCVEFYLDLDRAGDLERAAFDRDDVQLQCLPPGRAPAAQARLIVCGNPAFPADQAAYRAERTPAGWGADLRIPWTAVEALAGRRPRAIGFSVSVRDVGSDWRERRRAIWAGGNDNYRDTRGFGLLLLP
ncbi:MAG: hypothetical protein L6R48_08215 [Planctomycetes bacterium]|nr:hypothetical protein [Planctomycetota bacterium]